MSQTVIALIISLSFAVWLYSKLNRSTGGNAKSAASGAIIAGFICFLVVLLILSIILKRFQ